MVSAEGACAAYYQYGRYRDAPEAPCMTDGDPAQGARERRRSAARSSSENAAGARARARARSPSASRAGGRLFAMGNGGSACDAQHVAVEFQHPIIEKRRALPALALVARHRDC